jgi:type I restriction enzyme M protein
VELQLTHFIHPFYQISPYPFSNAHGGNVLDPACGSAGMFVQTGHFVENRGEDAAAKITFYGQEKSDTNTRLARMNLAVHGLEGIIRQGNTFYDRWEELLSSCDFVMSNPPFNVDG